MRGKGLEWVMFGMRCPLKTCHQYVESVIVCWTFYHCCAKIRVTLQECSICCRMTLYFPSHCGFPPRCRCGEWVRLPLITPCCHLLCFLCVKSNKLACALPVCGLPYRMQARGGNGGGGGRKGMNQILYY